MCPFLTQLWYLFHEFLKSQKRGVCVQAKSLDFS